VLNKIFCVDGPGRCREHGQVAVAGATPNRWRKRGCRG
jgi:hypothetical protein